MSLIVKRIASYFCLVLTISCSSTIIQEGNVIYVDKDNIKNISFSDWFSGVELIPLETNQSSLLNKCHKMLYEHNRFYIFDINQRAVLAFDSAGIFLFSSLPFMGQGPGEYVSITDFCINPFTGNLEILDPFSKVIRIYDKDGDFIKNTNLTEALLPMREFIPLSSDLYLFESSDYKKRKSYIKVFSISKKEILKEILSSPENTKDLVTTNLVIFSRLENKVLYSYEVPDNNVFHIDTTVTVVDHYQYDFGKYTLNLKFLPGNEDQSFYRKYYEMNIDKYVFPCNKPENIRYRFCFFLFKNNMFISRQKKESLSVEVALNKFNDGGILIPPIYVDENYFYFAIEPIGLDYFLPKEMLTTEQQELVSGIKEDDNPIIVKYKLK